MRAKLRRHGLAIIAAATYNLIFFFPVLFMRRVVSPNDVFWNFDPWAIGRVGQAQNSLLNDPPTSYFTLMMLLKQHWAAFHWNPYVASGIPGFGASPLLTPFISIPVLLLPPSWFYTGIILLKLNVAFFFAYLWLREERLGKRGAAIGAIVIAGASVYSVRWLWQITNATALYPALLWVVARLARGKRTSLTVVALIALAYALAGFPAAMAYGAYAALLYALFLSLFAVRSSLFATGPLPANGEQRAANSEQRIIPVRPLASAVAAVIIAGAIASPAITTFAQFVRRTGYLDIREHTSEAVAFPLSHWRSFFDPERLGNPAEKDWLGSRELSPVVNNYIESTVYVGLGAIALAPFVLANRRARARWFWIAASAFLILCMFGVRPLTTLAAHLPGIKYSPLTRLVFLLPLPAGYLAAGGSSVIVRAVSRWKRIGSIVAVSIAIATAADLAIVAGRFHPYLTQAASVVQRTPVIRYLRSQPRPFRIAPMMNYLWPNSSELFRVEDIRSHFGSEARYRRLLQRIDPSCWSGGSTVLTFDSRYFNFTDPLVGMLGVRYLIEHRSIDIIKWSIFANTVPGVQEVGALPIRPRDTLQRTIRVTEEPFWAIELPVSVDAVSGLDPRIVVSLHRFGQTVYERAFSPAEIAVVNKVYIPLRPHARLGDDVILRVRSIGVSGSLLRAEAPPSEAPIFYGRVKTPIILDRELPDGRIFINLAEVPRFHAVRRVRKLSEKEFLADRTIDLREEAVITNPGASLPAVSADPTVQLARYEDDEQWIDTDSPAPFFLASSEKLTPELRITVDGKRVSAVEINSLFAGVQIPAGSHRVVFQRRIGGRWWIVSAAAVLLLIVMASREFLSEVRPRG